MKTVKFKNIKLADYAISLDSDNEKILSVNSSYEAIGEKIADIKSGDNIFNIYSNCKIVSSDFDPSSASDNVIYFVTE